MRDSVPDLKTDLQIKIRIHEGPCLAVTLNDRLDYFGQTVNVAARVQSLAESRAIFATKSVVADVQVSKMLEADKFKLTEQQAALRGVADTITVYRIP
jgi:class 3 adenylate cyclase